MSVTAGEASVAALLAAIADPAVVVDAGGLVVGWSPAAQALFGIAPGSTDRSLEALAGPRADRALRVALVDPAGATLLVWPARDGGLAPEDIALEKLDIIGRIAGGVSHDLMSPLGAVMGFAELQASDRNVPFDLRESAETMIGAAQRVKTMIRTMLAFSRGLPPSPELVAPAQIVQDVMGLLDHATMNMHPRVVVPDGLPDVEADRGQLGQALLAILLNALEAQGTTWSKGAQPVEGRLTVSGSAVDSVQGKFVRLAIADGGPVVPVQERAALFGGSGVGRAGRDLAVARVLVERIGGRVSYEAVPDGNRIVVELPVAGTTLLPRPEAAPVGASVPVVLICDAEQLIRTLLVRFTARLGTQPLEARDSREALAILTKQPVAMVIADLAVERGGAELYEQAIALRPELATRFVLVSGDPGSPQIVEFSRRTGVPVVPKPLDQGRLEQLVRIAING